MSSLFRVSAFPPFWNSFWELNQQTAVLVCHIFQALWCNGEHVWLLKVVWRPSTVVCSPTRVVFSLYIKLLILPINNCFCYHPLIFISPWCTMWQLLLQPDVIFPLKWAAFSKPFFYFAFHSPCSDLSAVFESLLSNQTKIQAPLSPHINPSLVCHLQLIALFEVSFLFPSCTDFAVSSAMPHRG